jgi:hypothetical protein
MFAPRALIFVGLTAGAGAALGQAQGVTEIWKCQEASGRYTYTNEKRDTAGKKCELVSREINVVAPQKPPATRPGASPRESSEARATARNRQREILEGELKKEEELLAKGRAELAAQEAVRNGDERNYAKVLERLQPFKDNVELHEKNIEALKRELNNLNR